MLGTKSAATDPFTDFSVDRVSRLSITRTYNSSDFDLQTVGAGGVFGNAWHHNWEASLKCTNGVCTVKRGLLSGYKFGLAGTSTSLDGSEAWNIYQAYAPVGYTPAHRNILVQRPNGEWIVFLTDGRELHFQTVCTACDGTGTYCQPILSGGTARLVKAVDAKGNSVRLSYDGQHGILLGLTDDLGHKLELRNGGSCQAYATELQYDGVVVARYTVTGKLLQSAVDADGKTLRSYVHVNLGAYWPRLQAVLNEAGTAITEFSYDSSFRATGVVDTGSSVAVSYAANGSAVVTDYFRGPNGDTSSSSERQLDWNRRVTSISDGCACGPPKTLQWTPGGQLSCSMDAQGRITFQEFDALGRVTHRVQYTGVKCEVPATLPPDSSEAWWTYGVARPIAQGLSLDLDFVTATSRRSALSPASYSGETSDYNQAASAIDPPGYACTASSLPVGSVLCRQISSGYVTGTSGPVMERHATFFSYDTRGRLVRQYGPVDLDRPGPNDVPPIEERTYWADGDASARQGRLYQVKRYSSPTAQPLVTAYDYDMFGVSRITAPDGTQAMIIKDGRGRTTYFVSADAVGTVQARTESRYYDGNTPRLRILPSGAAERYSFDTKGRLQKTEYLSSDPEASGANPSLGWSKSYVYDQAGNTIHAERRDAMGHVTWQQDRAFDVQHRVVWESNPSLPSASKRWTYDPSGFLTETTDEEGRGTGFTPDGLDRVQRVRRTGLDALGNPTGADVATYQYAPNQSTLSSVTDGAAHATGYTYDDFGRVAGLTSATLSRGGGAWFRYDARGNLVGRGDQNVTVTYGHDGLDRVLSVAAQNTRDGSSVSYQYRYDENGFAGRLTSIVEPDRTSQFTYDWAGRLKTEVLSENGIPVPLTTTYVYDANGLRQLTSPTGLTVQLDRDPATRQVTRVGNVATGAAYASSITRVPGGPIASLAFGNGRTLAQTFNLRHEPLSIHDGPVWLSYTPTPAGDIGVVTDQSEDPAGCVRHVSRSASYDFLDRLGGWNDAVGTGVGVCSAETLGSQAAGFTYVAGTDQIASQRAPDVNGQAVYAFGYDFAGNISAIGQYDAAGSSIAQAVCLRHDALGRMVLLGTTGTAPSPGGTACVTDAEVTAALGRFKYDSRNRRVARQVGGQWTYVVSDGTGNPLSELALAGGTWTKVRDYVWLDGRLLAQVEYAGSSAYTYYAHVDHLGAPRALTNASGQLVWATFQRPYAELGEKVVPDPLSGQTVVTNLRLPGQYDERLLAGIGLQGPYYNWNRWYLPGVGRYVEADPLAMAGEFNGPYGVGWYGYASQNPLAHYDPDGRLDPGGTGTVIIKGLEGLGGATGTGVWIYIGGGALLWLPPAPTGGDPCENSPEGCVKPSPKPDNPPPPPPPPPTPPKPPGNACPKDDCWKRYEDCLNSPLGSKKSHQWGYSQCLVCREQCTQNGGNWPKRARNGGRCE